MRQHAKSSTTAVEGCDDEGVFGANWTIKALKPSPPCMVALTRRPNQWYACSARSCKSVFL
jgi:hypothetical protein